MRVITHSAFPSVAQMAAAAYFGSAAQALPEITRFASLARELSPQLTDRGAVVLFAVAKRPGISVKELETVIQSKIGVIYAVLRGLHDLSLIEVRHDREAAWLKTVSPTAEGESLVARVQA